MRVIPTTRRRRAARLGLTATIGVALAVAAVALALRGRASPPRATPVYDPPVLAGQVLFGPCSGGFYARLGDHVVLTSTGHCTTEGTVATDPDGTGVRGVFGPPARDATCPIPGHTCASSDIDYLVVAADRIPWGHLDLVDMGAGGYRRIAPGTKALSCDGIHMGATAEIDGRGIFRSGRVLEKGENNQDPALDGAYFPCMATADIQVASGDSGGAVFVDGLPAGVTSRSFGGNLGFTPLAEGLAQLGLMLCDAPDCGLTPPG